METEPAISVENLGFSYGTHQALKDVSFCVQVGEIFGLLGPNGGGKTTLFRLLSTLLPMQSGEGQILGRNLETEAQSIREEIGMTFQSPSLDVRLSVLENLRFQGMLYGLSGQILIDRIDLILSDLGLNDRRTDRVDTLSGGLKRRVEISKGLLHNPALLLLDEPSTGLDPGARRQLWSMLSQLREERGVTILVTTHLMDEAEQCDRLAILNQGQLIATGTPRELRETVGGDCVVLEADDPEMLAERIGDVPDQNLQILPGMVRIETAAGTTFLHDAMSKHGELIKRASVGRPTLEDVFVHHTGQRFWEAGS